MDLDDEPLLVTNSRGSFLTTRLSAHKVVRYGFSECALEEEAPLLRELYRTLWAISERHGWSNRCSSLSQAKTLLESFGLLARTLLVPLETLGRVCGQEISLEDAQRLTLAQGCVAEVDGMRVQFSALPEGQMILATSPPLVGIYTRIDNYVGMVLRKVSQSVVLINELVR